MAFRHLPLDLKAGIGWIDYREYPCLEAACLWKKSGGRIFGRRRKGKNPCNLFFFHAYSISTTAFSPFLSSSSRSSRKSLVSRPAFSMGVAVPPMVTVALPALIRLGNQTPRRPLASLLAVTVNPLEASAGSFQSICHGDGARDSSRRGLRKRPRYPGRG